MLKKTVNILIRVAMLAVVLFSMPVSAAAAGNMGRHQVIDGVSVYLGILPIQMAKNEADELDLPSKVYTKKNRYYVLFALFDQKSGRRIVDAKIRARIYALGGLNFSEKELTPIHIEKLISFGNYFRMADPDLYHIEFRITLPGRDKPVSGSFDYQRPVK